MFDDKLIFLRHLTKISCLVLQQRPLSENLQLYADEFECCAYGCCEILVEMSISLEAFHKCVLHTRTENSKIGLSVQDLLKNLEENLKRSSRQIDAW
jgi:hypothetical protein